MKHANAGNPTTVGFDADDTLWHNERFYKLTQERFADLLRDHADRDHLAERLLAAERRNMGHYGFGVKGFVLSMIETAIEVTDRRVPADVIQHLIDAGREMLAFPIELLPHAERAVTELADNRYRLILITKGDLLDQERKLAQSGLGDLFDAVEIVSEKNAGTYRAAFAEHGDGPERAVMIGNSVKSDVIPAIEAGAWGIHVTHDLTWELEKATAPVGHPRFRRLRDLEVLPDLILSL